MNKTKVLELFRKLLNSVTIKTSKKSKITASILTSILLLVVVFFNDSFMIDKSPSRWLLLSVAMVLPLVIGLITAFEIEFKNPKLRKFLYVALFFLMPVLSITMTECLNGIWVYDMTYLGFLGNYALMLLFYFFFFAITGSLKVAIISVTPVVCGLGIAHAYLMNFRGTPFIPMDFLGITTAINVGSTYDYSPPNIVIIAALLFVLIIVIAFKIKMPKFSLITRIITRSLAGIIFAVLMGLFYFTPVLSNAGINPDFWNQSRGYKNYGFVYNFFCNTKYLYMSEPSGYNPKDVSDYISRKVENQQPDSNTKEKTPNIICIMNESLSDLKVLGDFETNEDYMPFIHSLKKNTVKGNLYVPVIGAGTSNTEFEFLTGHSTAFLPSGSNAFMLYVKNPIASLVSTLEAQNYSSLAFHPYYASGWNRVEVYKFMGFNGFKSLENLIDISIMDDYIQNSSNPDYLQNLIAQNYPDRNNMLIRQYVSDDYDFDVLIKDFENRDNSKPYFAFNVTMQNHGGYTTTASNFVQDISIPSATEEYTKALNYLSLVKQSDSAFKKLINYFKKVKEPTVICMFGDHQPSVETKFIAEVMGVKDLSGLTTEQEQSRHITPFIIWANYDIKEEQIDKLSVNYLSSYVLKTAGVKLPKYNQYLLNLSKTIPVIDTVGYIDSDNNYYKWSGNSKYTDTIKEYEQIQYNNIFDYENNDTDTFFINGYSVKTIAEDIEKSEENENTDKENNND